jgi:hypothetical protein
LERIWRRPRAAVIPSCRSVDGHREDARIADVPEHFDSAEQSVAPLSGVPAFSGEACAVLGATVRSYLESGGVPDELANVTARLCREAHARGLTADETLAEIRASLGAILAACPLTSTDRAALVALAIDECVHAFYHEHH